MLTLIIGKDWKKNREEILQLVADDVRKQKSNRILLVPELISHDMERRLCAAAGDTSSRFAEVLSFTQLGNRVSDEAGHAILDCLDNGGRVVAMAAAARQLHSVLKTYASVETKPEFLTGLLDAIDEFKRCCITSEDLMNAAKKSEGTFAQKLEELSLLLEAYNALCQQGKCDPRDKMTYLLDQLKDCSFGEKHVFYVDGFPDFTRQHFSILEYLISVSDKVVVSLNCDRPASGLMAFEKAGNTAQELLNAAAKMGVKTEIKVVSSAGDGLDNLLDRLFQGQLEQVVSGEQVVAFKAESVTKECIAAVQKVQELVQNGARYREIGIVCSDMTIYQNPINMIFKRCGIPIYISGSESVLEKSVILTVLSAIDAALSGFEQRDVIKYMKSMLSPLPLDISDQLENYVVIWNITGAKWLQEWKNHPRGLREVFSEADTQQLMALNAARLTVLQPLIHLREEFKSAISLGQQVLALYAYLEEINLAERLSELAAEMDRKGDNRSAQILNQLWDILIGALEQLYDILGNTVWDAEAFTRLLRLLLSQYDVGTIPPVLDSITVGPVSAMRCQQVKHLIVLGAVEGSLPGYSGASGILNDQERTELRKLGVPLTGGALEGLQNEYAEIYGAFCGAEETITVSYPSGQPSFLYRRISLLSGGEKITQMELGMAMADSMEACAYLMRFGADNLASDLQVNDLYNELCKHREYSLGEISAENICGLYGERLHLSASQIDKQADCRLSYFLKYGMRAKERKIIEIDPAEFGTYVHYVLEHTAKNVVELGGFHKVTVEQTMAIAEEVSEVYISEHFGQLDTDRIAYLLQRNRQELLMIVEELWHELSSSEFSPCAYELEFSEKGTLPSIQLPGNLLNAQLSGFVDRVDCWKKGDTSYYRIVDYKTGKKDFDYCDVFNGLGLQMLLYLFALENNSESILGENAYPAGVQYFPARAPYISADGSLTYDEAVSLREKSWKRKGLLLADSDVLMAMDGDENSKRLPCSRRKDGSLTGDLADGRQFKILKTYIYSVLRKMIDDIASGCVEPNPYTRGSSHNACFFCQYSTICHNESLVKRRNYKAMTAERFWDEIGKEMNKHG